MVDATSVASEFYGIMALKILVESEIKFGNKSHEKLSSDLEKFSKRYNSILVEMLYDYTSLVVFGEMRNAVRYCDSYHPNISYTWGRELISNN